MRKALGYFVLYVAASTLASVIAGCVTHEWRFAFIAGFVAGSAMFAWGALIALTGWLIRIP